MNTRTDDHKERGFVLIFSFGLMVFLTILGFASLSRTVHEEQMGRWSAGLNRAVALAEASIDASIKKLRVGDFTDLPTLSMAEGTYWAQISPTGGPLHFLITGHGLYESAPSNLEAVTQLVQTSVFQFALFGSQQVVVSGDVMTDSYDSRSASYDPSNAGSDGDIGTNSIGAGGIDIQGNLLINGQLAVGPDVADPNSVVTISGGSATITANPPVVSLSAAMPMPDVIVPAGMTCNNLTVNGGAPKTLSSAVGTYCFHNLKLNGGAILTADGPVTVYITGQFSAGGNTTVGISSAPSQFVMLLASSQTVTIESSLTGTTQFYGGLYAPTATIKIDGNAQVFGSVVSKTVDAPGNVQIHYDEALSDLAGPTGFYKVRLLSWREL